MSTTDARVRAPELPVERHWINSEPLQLASLRGKLVLLDFWTYCCINCLHVLPDLKRLQEKYADQLVVIGVHSAKFDNEGHPQSLQQAVARHGVRHPVVNDHDRKVWNSYAVKMWPTLVLIDPEGYIACQLPGEGNYDLLDETISALADVYKQAELLDERPWPGYAPPVTHSGRIRFPGKLIADLDSERLFISDSGHHRIVVTDFEGVTLEEIGSGQPGTADGSFGTSQFNNPQGLALWGDRLLVADADNHLIRSCHLGHDRVATIAGTGRQSEPPFQWEIRKGTQAELNSPWDLLQIDNYLFIAMAGAHQVWLMDLYSGEIGPYAGSGTEGLVDGSLNKCALAQPSGLATNGKHLFVADSEVSAVRAVPFNPGLPITTVAGRGLFEFGDQDGVGDSVRLQHPLGLAFHEGALYVADTYNHKIKQVDPAYRRFRTLAGDGVSGFEDGRPGRLFEPADLCVVGGRLFVADTNNHAIRALDPARGTLETVISG